MQDHFKRSLILSSLLGVLGAAAPALADTPDSSTAPTVKEDCLLRSQMRSWKSSEDLRSIIIMISPGRGYKVGFLGGECRSLRFAGLTAALSSGGNGACVSRGDRIVFSNNLAGDDCVIDSIEKLPPPPDKPN